MKSKKTNPTHAQKYKNIGDDFAHFDFENLAYQSGFKKREKKTKWEKSSFGLYACVCFWHHYLFPMGPRSRLFDLVFKSF